MRIKNEYGDIISMKERPTGAEKLQTNFSFDLMIDWLIPQPVWAAAVVPTGCGIKIERIVQNIRKWNDKQ